MNCKNKLLTVLCFLVIAVVFISIAFICGKANHKTWADYSALSAIISVFAFVGVLCTIYFQHQNAKDDLRARHILLQIEMALRWAALRPNDDEAQANCNINIRYLEEELGKISGFNPDYAYWRRVEDGFNKKSE